MWYIWALCVGVHGFVSKWQVPANQLIELPLTYPVYNIQVNWGDGTPTAPYTATPVSHTYVQAGNYTISITGIVDGFSFANAGSKDFLTSISSWGNFTIDNTTTGTFFGCTNLATIDAPDQPIFRGPGAQVTYMFKSCTSLNSPLSWDMTGVVEFWGMFEGASTFNSPLQLITPDAVSMMNMFQDATAFNQPINFVTPNLVDATSMFYLASSMNSPVMLNTEKITSVLNMFSDAFSFTQDLRTWNLNSVVSCADFCRFCPLPSFPNCSDPQCATVTNFRGAQVCSCPPGEYPINGTHCGTMFVTEWEIPADQLTLQLPLTNGVYDIQVNWGEGDPSSYTAPPVTNTYSKAGTYRVSILGVVDGFTFNGAAPKDLLKSIHSWGKFTIDNATDVFGGCTNLATIDAPDQPIFRGPNALVTYMFGGCTFLNSPLSWDMTGVKGFGGMFQGATKFNSPLHLITPDAESMVNMFQGATAFNQPINFVTPNLILTTSMFLGATSLNSSVTLTTGRITHALNMFSGANSFFQDLSAWNVTLVSECGNFCPFCGLPNFPNCVPCTPKKYNSRGAQVCNCPPNEDPLNATHCGTSLAPSSAPTQTPTQGPTNLTSRAPTRVSTTAPTAADSVSGGCLAEASSFLVGFLGLALSVYLR